ncbi:MAG: hypothetical protein GX199_08760 [Firmicutes bacterium]|nr:hypothetical protein [Bacillota bacterium]
MVGAGVGFGAASLLGQPGLLGALFGGVLGLIGGAAQAQAEAAERQIEAAEKLVEAARQMTTEERFGAIDQTRRAISDTEATIAKLEDRLGQVTAAGAIVGGGVGAVIGGIVGGPVGALIGGLLGGLLGGSTAKKNQQQKIQALTEQLEAQRRALEQLIEDFKSALGLTVGDLVGTVQQAFSTETVEDFAKRLETSLLHHVRDALIAGFLESAAMRPLFETLSDQIFEAVRDGVATAGELDTIRDVISQISDRSEQFFVVLDELGLGMKDLSDTVKGVNEALRNVPTGFKIALRRFHAADPIPMAEGGIVTRPTFALLGERGPEAVIPLEEGGGRIVVEVHVEGSIYADDFEERVSRAVTRAARKAGLMRYGLAGGRA